MIHGIKMAIKYIHIYLICVQYLQEENTKYSTSGNEVEPMEGKQCSWIENSIKTLF